MLASINSNQAQLGWFGEGLGKLFGFRTYGSKNHDSNLVLDTAMKVNNLQINEVQLAQALNQVKEQLQLINQQKTSGNMSNLRSHH